ncbi:amino acid ABC transporter permease [Anaerorhabdus furcosa]|uniref:Cystine transport system permease protein n=1 Tax=Anaerorhabdus furcosa TaxID=118967 RepID=A0A1T4K2D8_9FIRM|nr:amino acid ABC transporter permease [Anaerorhabdus furcosa]SJZ36437.1 cystine transport system permease protein [Anaerorhabdus furcosa]
MNERLIEILIDSFWKIVVPGLTMTIPLTIISFSIAILLALFIAMMQMTNNKILNQIARFYVWIIRGTPLLVQLYVIFYGLPNLGILIDPFPAAVIVFALNTGAYDSETIRAAIEAIPKGQLEAGYCVGMTTPQIMIRIVLPQALRIAFPSLSNSLISLVKDTSLASNITILEMLMATQRIIARTYEPFALYCEVGLIYLIICTVLTKLQHKLESTFKLEY